MVVASGWRANCDSAGGRVLFLRFGGRIVRTVSFWRRFGRA
ncbi:hypothetical protein M3J09_006227 [Ascochyta lentis]